MEDFWGRPNETHYPPRRISPSLPESGARMIPIHKGKTSAGWREVRGKDVYFRSRWEFNYCLYLQWLFSKKLIALWKYEPRTFWFEKIKRGVCSYKPDFEVWNCDGSIEYHEVKGYDYPRGKTARKRMAKYYPDVKLRLIDADWFKTEGKKLAWLPGWEK